MSYSVHCIGTKFCIPEYNLGIAFDALRVVKPPRIGMNNYQQDVFYADPLECTKAVDLVELLQVWNHQAVSFAKGDLVALHPETDFYSEAGHKALYEALAPYVTKGSHLDYIGEDGAHWRWEFDGRKVVRLTGRVVYEDPNEPSKADPATGEPKTPTSSLCDWGSRGGAYPCARLAGHKGPHLDIKRIEALCDHWAETPLDGGVPGDDELVHPDNPPGVIRVKACEVRVGDKVYDAQGIHFATVTDKSCGIYTTTLYAGADPPCTFPSEFVVAVLRGD